MFAVLRDGGTEYTAGAGNPKKLGPALERIPLGLAAYVNVYASRPNAGSCNAVITRILSRWRTTRMLVERTTTQWSCQSTEARSRDRLINFS